MAKKKFKVISLILINLERCKGLPSSVLMFLFWALLALSSLILVYQKIANYFKKVTV